MIYALSQLGNTDFGLVQYLFQLSPTVKWSNCRIAICFQTVLRTSSRLQLTISLFMEQKCFFLKFYMNKDKDNKSADSALCL